MSNYPADEEAKELILDIGRRMYEKNYVASNDGNITVRVGENELWTTPTGVSKGFMNTQMLVKVDLDGNILEGDHRPSSELKMHLQVYHDNPKIGGVVHAHPLVATCFSICEIPLNEPILAEGVVQLGEVPVAPYADPGSQEVPASIAGYALTHCGVLLAHHGATTWGQDAMQAYMRMESLEYYAKVTLITKFVMDRAVNLNEDQLGKLLATRRRLFGQ